MLATPGLLLINLVLVWGSVVAGLLLKWRLLFLPFWLAIPLGVLGWLAGLGVSCGARAERRRRRRNGGGGIPRFTGIAGYPFATARLMMNLGVGLAFRSWPTLIVACLFYPVAVAVAKRRNSTLAVTPRQLERLQRRHQSGRLH
ncbi:MAG: hypothetical protein ACYC55_03645 [Candidatus Geothermincolia bacterium]